MVPAATPCPVCHNAGVCLAFTNGSIALRAPCVFCLDSPCCAVRQAPILPLGKENSHSPVGITCPQLLSSGVGEVSSGPGTPEPMQVMPAYTDLPVPACVGRGEVSQTGAQPPCRASGSCLAAPKGHSSKEILCVWPVSHGSRNATGFAEPGPPWDTPFCHTFFSLGPSELPLPVAGSLAHQLGGLGDHEPAAAGWTGARWGCQVKFLPSGPGSDHTWSVSFACLSVC